MDQPPPIRPEKKKGLGCVGCGCLILVVLTVLFFGGLAACVYITYSAIYGLTSDHGEVVGTEDKGPAVDQEAHEKITAFQNDVAAQKTSTLTLNSDEINTLIAEEPDLARLKNHVYVILNGDLATLQMSVPLAGLPAHLYEGRFFNSTVSGNMEIVDGKIGLRLVQLDLLGRTHSGHELDSVQSIDWDSILRGNPQASAWLQHVKSFKIENGQLEITSD